VTLRRLAAAAAVAGMVLLAGCANAHAQGLVQQACGHVETSLTLYHRSLTEPEATATQDRAQALAELRRAMPIAATAAGEAPQWQALMATLAESSRGVPESYLVSALSQQCNMAVSGTAPSVPLTVPPTTPASRPTVGTTSP
jgi:hypothetical protein